MKYKLLIFDFDGTLADTEEINMKIFSDMSEEYNIRKVHKSEINDLKKMHVLELINHLNIKKRNIPSMIKQGRNMLNIHIDNVGVCKENIKDVLTELKEDGVELGIITSNSVKNVEKFLKNHGIDFFSFVISSGILGKKRKIEKIIRKNKYMRKEILYVGDEIRDIKAAHESNIHIAVVDWGFNNPDILIEYNPEYIISCPGELINICRGEYDG